MPAPSKSCRVCEGNPVQYKFFVHPMCSADSDLVVKATCTKCLPPKGGHNPQDLVGGFHHELVGKIRQKRPIDAPKTQFALQLGWDEHQDRQRKMTLLVRPYVGPKQEKYTKILRAVNWNHLTPNYVYPEEGPSCGFKPAKKENRER